jgi:hypothetical protein
MKLNIVSIAGGLGNQMFQYAFYLSLKHYWFPRDLNKKYIAPYEIHNGYELNNVFNIKQNIVTNLTVGFIKKNFKKKILKKQEKSGGAFEQINLRTNQPIRYFSGYWQSEKYFVGIEDKIRSTFKFDFTQVSKRNKSLISDMRNENAVSIHIRRGDYVNDPGAKMVLGGNCNLDYYKKAINYINGKIENPFYYIFSDDSEWVRENFTFLRNSIVIDWNKNKDNWQDMMLMSTCKHNIIANSSFSWWGAWLNSNPDKIVIAPKKWFNTFDATDIIPECWLRF